MSKKVKDETEMAVITAVKLVPALWDQSDKTYKENKTPYWAKAAELAGMEVGECMTVWNKMRNSLSRNRKRKSTGSGAEDVKSSFVYASEMEFVLPFVDPRPGRSSNISAQQSQVLFVEEDEQKSNSGKSSEEKEKFAPPLPRMPTTPASAKKKRRPDDNAALLEVLFQEDNDEEGLYGRSIAAFLRNLPAHLRRKAKIRFEQVKDDIEECMRKVSGSSTPSTSSSSYGYGRKKDEFLAPEKMPDEILEQNGYDNGEDGHIVVT